MEGLDPRHERPEEDRRRVPHHRVEVRRGGGRRAERAPQTPRERKLAERAPDQAQLAQTDRLGRSIAYAQHANVAFLAQLPRLAQLLVQRNHGRLMALARELGGEIVHQHCDGFPGRQIGVCDQQQFHGVRPEGLNHVVRFT
jgi:hypothetical protein